MSIDDRHSIGHKSPYKFIDYNKQYKINDAVFWLSYLAKVYTKGHRPLQANDFGSIRLKKNK